MKFFFLLPVAALCLAWYFGTRPSYRWGMVALAAWLAAAVVVADSWQFGGSIVVLMIAYAMFAVGLFVFTIAALTFGSRAEKAPVEYTIDAAKEGYQAYERLDPDKKEWLHRGAALAAKFACTQAGRHFERTGRKTTASVFKGAAKMM